jgi:hypothetical protein
MKRYSAIRPFLVLALSYRILFTFYLWGGRLRHGLAMYPRLAWNLGSSCLSLLSPGITDVHPAGFYLEIHANLQKSCNSNTGLSCGFLMHTLYLHIYIHMCTYTYMSLSRAFEKRSNACCRLIP